MILQLVGSITGYSVYQLLLRQGLDIIPCVRKSKDFYQVVRMEDHVLAFCRNIIRFTPGQSLWVEYLMGTIPVQ
jgi:hypothetical protein